MKDNLFIKSMYVYIFPIFLLLFIIYYNWEYFREEKGKLIVFIMGYIISVVYVFYNANPYGQLTKAQILNYIPVKYKPRTRQFTSVKSLSYPFVLKPSLCSSNARGVAIIHNDDELNKYLSQTGDINDLIMQDYINSEHEVGILYERSPLENDGRIVSIVERKIPNNKVITGGEGKERNDLITPELERVINHISKQIPNFHAGRYDIRFYDYEDLKKGKNIYILEANGCFGFDIASGDDMSVPSYVYRQCRWFLTRLYYGMLNLSMGKFNSLPDLVNRAYMCPTMMY